MDMGMMSYGLAASGHRLARDAEASQPLRGERNSNSARTARLPALSRNGSFPPMPPRISDPAMLSVLAGSNGSLHAAHETSDAFAQVAMLQASSPRSPDALLGSHSFISVSTPYDFVVTTPTDGDERAAQRNARDYRPSSSGRLSKSSANSKERLTFVSERSVTRDSATELARSARMERSTNIGDFTFDNPRDSCLRDSVRRVQAYSRREVPIDHELKSEVLYKKRVCMLVMDREIVQWKRKSRVKGTIDTDDIVAASAVDGRVGCFRIHYFIKGRGRNEKALLRKYKSVDFYCEPWLAERWILAIQELVRWQARAPPIAQKRKIKIILNPHSGKRRARKIWYEQVHKYFELCNFDCYVEETAYGGHAIDMGKEYSADDGFEALVFVGGDGTVCEFMNGLLSRPEYEWREIVATTPISLISAGTQNAFGVGVGIPTIEAAVYCILKRKMRPLDVITAIAESDPTNVHYSYCGLGWGVAGDIAAESERFRWLGTSRYTFLKLKRTAILPKRHTGRVRYVPADPEPPLRKYYDIRDESALDQFDVEEGNVYDHDSAEMAHSWRRSWNGQGGALRSPGSNKRYHESMWETDHGNYMVVGACNTAPDALYAHPSDGNLDLLITRKGNLWHRLGLGILYLLGKETKSSLMLYRKVRAVIIEPDQADDCMNIDGEVLAGPGPWRMEIVPSLFKALSEK